MNLASLFRPKQVSSGIFIPSNNGFEELTTGPVSGSINDLATHLGYTVEQVHYYHGDSWSPTSKIQGVVFEVFTDNIIFVLTSKTVDRLSLVSLKQYLQGFNVLTEFDSVTSHAILTEGIQNGSLSIKFLSKALELKDTEPNGIFYSCKLELYLYFNGGLLTHFQPADGLNRCAKHWKQLNANAISEYESVAKKYWKMDFPCIINEINVQAEAMFETPNGFKNQFISLHRSELNTVNYKMLLVCHYNYPISLEEFLKINFGRYTTLNEADQNIGRSFKLGNFIYSFSPKGELMNKRRTE